jgi:uncharacterized membrane protein YwaF
MHETVTLSSLLALSVTLLSLGVDIIRQGQYVAGSICLIVGFGVMLVAVMLYEKSIIQKLKGGGESG